MVQPSSPSRNTTLPRETHPFLVYREASWIYQSVMRLKARQPRMTSPLITLIGPQGCGKSHIARQLQREVQEERTATQIVRTSAAQFTGELQRASRLSRLRDFQQQHRERVDLLIFEDLHELGTRPETTQQLVAMLDDVLAAGGRVLLTTRTTPGEIRGLSRRLVNRCQGGVLLEMVPPGESSKRKLLNHFAEAQNLVISEEVVQLLARKGPSVPGDLLALIIKIRQARTPSPISPESVERWLASEGHPVTLGEVARKVARHYRVKLADLRSANRQASLVAARHVAMFLARELAQTQFAEIGKYFGGRNHASVIYACQRVEELRTNDPALHLDVEQLSTEISVGR